MKKLNFSTMSTIVYLFMILSDCVRFNYIEDREHILENINIFRNEMYSLPKELRLEAEKYIEEVINPIVYDLNYFDFLHKTEYGDLDAEGHFVINSDRSLEYMIFDLYNHTIELHEKLLKIFAKYIK